MYALRFPVLYTGRKRRFWKSTLSIRRQGEDAAANSPGNSSGISWPGPMCSCAEQMSKENFVGDPHGLPRTVSNQVCLSGSSLLPWSTEVEQMHSQTTQALPIFIFLTNKEYLKAQLCYHYALAMK